VSVVGRAEEIVTVEAIERVPAPYLRGPQLAPIKALHRHDGYISFAVRGYDPDEWRQVISIRATALDEWFPHFTQQLLRDSMVSINASYCLALRRTDLPYGATAHRKDTLRYLCACFVDLDYYNLGLKSYQVAGELARMREAGEIPQTSLTIDSGHGMWLMWMLHDQKDPTRAHLGAYDDNPNDHLQLYTKINREMARRLVRLGADSSPSAAAHARIPGSFRNDTERYIEWTAHGNAERPYSYTLKELATALGIELLQRPMKEREALTASRQTRGNRSRGWKRSKENRLTAIATIKDLRGGGFAKRTRNKGAYFYALALRWNGESREGTTAAVMALGRQCGPPLTESECLGAIKQAFKSPRSSSNVRYQTLADQLDVCPAEAEYVTQRIGKPFPAASRFGELVPLTKLSGQDTREVRIFKRREAIREILAEVQSGGGRRPSFRQMADLIRSRTRQEVSYVTVREDYRVLGIESSFKPAPVLVTDRLTFPEEIPLNRLSGKEELDGVKFRLQVGE
jgi:hypothetical protein